MPEPDLSAYIAALEDQVSDSRAAHSATLRVCNSLETRNAELELAIRHGASQFVDAKWPERARFNPGRAKAAAKAVADQWRRAAEGSASRLKAPSVEKP